MIIKLNFENSNYIVIRLLKKSGIARWFNIYKEAVAENQNFYKKHYVDNMFVTNQDDKTIIRAEWENIKHVLKSIDRMNIDIPSDISESFDYKQSTLNLLHRFFTSNAEKSNKRIYNNNIVDIENIPLVGYESYVSQESWLSIIDRINNSVHTLENFVSTDTKSILATKYPLSYIKIEEAFNSINLSEKSRIIRFDDEEQASNYRSLDYSRGPIVTLSQSILGKCFLQSFYEEDDPTESDCAGRKMSTGGFYIDIDNTRQRIYESDEFKTWLKKYNIQNQLNPLEFQIGNVIDSTMKLKYFKHCNLRNVEFNK